MPILFGVDIAKIIGQQLGPKLLPATLRTFSIGARDETSLTDGVTTIKTEQACRGFCADYSTHDYGALAGIVQIGDRKIILLGATLGGLIPVDGSEVDIEGATYTLVGPISRDPVGATYTCNGRLK